MFKNALGFFFKKLKVNGFTNFPVNYGAGRLRNITRKSTTQILTYKNTINYTKLASSRTYKTFTNPL